MAKSSYPHDWMEVHYAPSERLQFSLNDKGMLQVRMPISYVPMFTSEFQAFLEDQLGKREAAFVLDNAGEQVQDAQVAAMFKSHRC